MKTAATYSLERWTRPDSYMGAEWPEYYVFLGRNRDSDDLAESNFACGLKAIGGESETVQIIREHHWAVGWIEWIAIHESDSAALETAREICERLNDYPAIDEYDWAERERETADIIWRDCYEWQGRIEYIRDNRSQFYFRNMAVMMQCVRGEYFNGYAAELIG